jgi:hypothetical protein
LNLDGWLAAESRPAVTDTVMPSFDSAKREGSLIGRLLAGYGELELEMAACAMAANDEDVDMVIKKLFLTRGEYNRIVAGDKLMKPQFEAAQLGKIYARTIKNMHFCRDLRNQYAHCNWHYTATEGLSFVDLERVAKWPRRIKQITRYRRPLSVELLERQEAYFRYVQKCFWYLAEAYKIKTGTLIDSPLWPRPAIIARPPKYLRFK